MPTKIIWHQKDREDAPTRARRTLIEAEAALSAMWDLYDGRLEHLTASGPALLTRALKPLSEALLRARTLVDAYDYYVTRCLEAGLTPEQAHAGWDEWSSEDFEADLVEAESYGPNAIAMIDETILARLGIVPLEPREEDTDDDEGMLAR